MGNGERVYSITFNQAGTPSFGSRSMIGDEWKIVHVLVDQSNEEIYFYAAWDMTVADACTTLDNFTVQAIPTRPIDNIITATMQLNLFASLKIYPSVQIQDQFDPDIDIMTLGLG